MGVVIKVTKRGLLEMKRVRNQGTKGLNTFIHTDFEITACDNSTERKTVSQQPEVQCC